MTNLSKKLTSKDTVNHLKAQVYQMEVKNFQLLQLIRGIKKEILGITCDEDKSKSDKNWFTIETIKKQLPKDFMVY